MAVKCLVPIRRSVLAATVDLDLTASACSPCPADERPTKLCGQLTANGGQGTTYTRHALGTTPGPVSMTYDIHLIPDRDDYFKKGYWWSRPAHWCR